MMIFDRQQVASLLIEPMGAGQGLALGTVTVATGVVGDPLTATIEAMLDRAAERGRAAAGQVMQRLALPRGQHVAEAVAERIAVLPDPLRHFQGRPLPGGGHPGPSAGAAVGAFGLGSTSRSSRLGVCWRRWVLTGR